MLVGYALRAGVHYEAVHVTGGGRLKKPGHCAVTFLHSYPEWLSPKIVNFFRVDVVLIDECSYCGDLAARRSPPQRCPSAAILEVGAIASY
jgi:hypothetical protein